MKEFLGYWIPHIHAVFVVEYEPRKGYRYSAAVHWRNWVTSAYGEWPETAILKSYIRAFYWPFQYKWRKWRERRQDA